MEKEEENWEETPNPITKHNLSNEDDQDKGVEAIIIHHILKKQGATISSQL